MKYVSVILIVTLMGMMVNSCSTCSRQKADDFVVPDSVRTVTLQTTPESVIKDVVDNISSPIETAALFKSLNVPFSQRYVATTKNLSLYNTSYDKAFNLGVFGADLGYINMYEKTALVSVYIVAMKSLADDLSIGQFFNYATLKRLSDNNRDIDSLIYITQHSFNKMDRYLRQSGRGNLSVVMVSGVWVEALYLSCQFYKETKNERLAESIAEQKFLLDKLLEMLAPYKSQKEIAEIVDELMTVAAAFKPVTMTSKAGKLETIENKDGMRVVQHETTVVNYTADDLAAIIKSIEAVRTKLIK